MAGPLGRNRGTIMLLDALASFALQDGQFVVAARLLGAAASVQIEGTVDRDHPVRPDVTLFNEVRLRFAVHGVTREQAVDLVERFKKR